MSFPDKLHVSVDKEANKVRLSVKLSDDVVIVVEGSIPEFDLLVAHYQAAKQE